MSVCQEVFSHNATDFPIPCHQIPFTTTLLPKDTVYEKLEVLGRSVLLAFMKGEHVKGILFCKRRFNLA